MFIYRHIWKLPQPSIYGTPPTTVWLCQVNGSLERSNASRSRYFTTSVVNVDQTFCNTLESVNTIRGCSGRVGTASGGQLHVTRYSLTRGSRNLGRFGARASENDKRLAIGVESVPFSFNKQITYQNNDFSTRQLM